MRVSHQSDHITHAVVGAKDAQELGISNSAEFFHILSSTLYSDKPLAVVREVLCNAWDAHIEFGCTDKAVEVTLDNEKMIIRDFGPGISHDDIVPIYGTYGASTKAANENVTGGFGLGCKSPFAYTDHFAVTSCHNGVKTIYRMALSAAQLGGKPSIVKIMELPTTETGMMVEIDLKNSGDYSIFLHYVRRIASLGEMKVELNGSLVPVIPFSKAKAPFVLVRRKHMKLPSNSSTAISVRCGNVVYPLPEANDYATEFMRVTETLRKITGNSYSYYPGSSDDHWHLVLLAPPGSISPTPSRESISLTEHSTKTITDLLQRSMKMLSGSKDNAESFKLIREEMEKRVRRNTHRDILLGHAPFYPQTSFRGMIRHRSVLYDRQDVTTAALSYQYPAEARNFDFNLRLEYACKSGLIAPSTARSLRKAYRVEMARAKRPKYGHQRNTLFSDNRNTWFHKVFTAPVVMALKAADLNPRQLLHIKTIDEFANRTDAFSRVMESAPIPPSQIFPFFHRMLVVAYNRNQIVERVHRYKEWPFARGSTLGALAFIVPRKQEIAEKAVDLFKQMGFKVIDLTKTPTWEARQFYVKRTAEEKVDRPVVTRKKGIPKLSSFELRKGHWPTFDFAVPFSEIENEDRVETPEAYVRVRRTENSASVLANFLNSGTFNLILEKFGDVIGVVNSTAAENKLSDAGIPGLHKFITDKMPEIFADKQLIEAVRNEPDYYNSFDMSYEHEQLYGACRSDPELRKEFDLAPPPSDELADLLSFFGAIQSRKYGQPEWSKQIDSMLQSGPDKRLVAFNQLVRKSQLISIIDGSSVAAKFESSKTDPKLKAQLRTLLKTVLKG